MALTTKHTRPSVRPEALESAFAFPALEAIFTRRARRFALGATMTGPLAFRSDKQPVPLAMRRGGDPGRRRHRHHGGRARGMAVCHATPARPPEPTSWPRSPGAASRARSRSTAPSCSGPTTRACSCSHNATTCPSATSSSRPRRSGASCIGSAIKLQDGRLEIPRRRPNLFKFNEWLVNTEGATVFIPVSDVTRQCISAMLLYFDRPHGYYIVDNTWATIH